MIKINLLPAETRKKEALFSKIDFSQLSVQKVPVLLIAAALAAILIVLQISVLAMNIYFGFSLASLTKRYAIIEPQKKEADLLKAQTDLINKKIGAIDELMGKRFSWAGKLNDLSDSITPGIWLAELDYDEKMVDKSGAHPSAGSRAGIPGTLIISGYASGVGEQGAALVGKFIKSLKDNQQFYSDFSRIELISVKSDRVHNQEVMKFRVSCFFK